MIRNIKETLVCFYILWGCVYSFACQTPQIKDDKSNCSNLNIAILGDSMSWIGGTDCEKPEGWTHYFKNSINPNSIRVYARSGATITNTLNTRKDPEAFSKILHDDNVIYNQVMRLKNDVVEGKTDPPDLVMIYAGANDAWFAKKRPGSYDPAIESLQSIDCEMPPSKATTIGESLALSIHNLKTFLPDARILIITPVEMTKVSKKKINDLGHVIESVARKLECDVLRADKIVDIRHEVEIKKFTCTSDGVHTNKKGAELLSQQITSFVKQNYCK